MTIITGTAGADSLVGGGANDGISGLDGDDTLLGGDGADSLLGDAGRDSLSGGSGADTLTGGAGNDTLSGDAGNDKLIFDAADGSINGGVGTDTLELTGAGVTLDLTLVPNTVLRDLEVIDITGTGNNTLKLAASDLLALSSTANILRLDGDAGDRVVTADGNWSFVRNLTIGGETYVEYVKGSAILQVDEDVHRGGIAQSEIELSELASSGSGFRLAGGDANDLAGVSVSTAGDFNGDGFDDLIHGALGIGGASVLLSGVTGLHFLGTGTVDDLTGNSVGTAGDVNADGFDDLIVGAVLADENGSDSGASYVVFGRASGIPQGGIALDRLNGANGFRLEGAAAGDLAGISVSDAGDLNGDGFADLIVGAHGADPNGTSSGASYVLFGKGGAFASSIDLATLNGNSGFRLAGVAGNDQSGYSVSSAGDVNGDGFGDVVIGAPGADPNGANSGAGYVLFGKASGFGASTNLGALNGSNGFRLAGAAASDQAGYAVSGAGDVNGDGFDDVVVGSRFADPNGSNSGTSYVVFGRGGFGANVNLGSLNGTNGFRLEGEAAGDRSGFFVSGAGDVNGDGFDDLIVGAPNADPNGTNSGASYVLFGKASGFAPSMDLSALDGRNGFQLLGVATGDFSGYAVSAAGDVNGDGFDDMFVGAYGVNAFGAANSGASYVIFGGDFTGAVTFLGTNAAETFTGTAAAEVFVSGLGNDTLIGGGGKDVFSGGAGTDTLDFSGEGAAVSVNIATGRANGTTSGNDRVDGIEHVIGSAFADSLSGSNVAETLSGAAGKDALSSAGGADLLDGGAGADTLNGASGNDTYNVDASDTLRETTGTDTVHVGSTYTLLSKFENLVLTGSSAINGTGNASANSITGNGGNNQLRGTGGNDTLVGGIGDDTLIGGGGNDSYVVNGTGDLVTENAGQGIDRVQSSIGYTLLADFEHLTLTGLSNINGTGNGLANIIAGNAGNNLLNGAAGNDVLDGGAGNDTLKGGGGNDVLIYRAVEGGVQGSTGVDTLRITGKDITLNLTTVADSLITDMEVIDLTGTGRNSLTLALGDLLAISSTTNTLRVAGNAGDEVVTTELGWVFNQNVAIGGEIYAEYTKGAATLQVDTNIDRGGIQNLFSELVLSDLDSANGFRVVRAVAGDQSGLSVSMAGDLNGDGFDDVIVGAPQFAVNDAFNGASYVVYGKASGFASSISLSTLDGSSGFRLLGAQAEERSGTSVSDAGDVNGDGFSDLIIGAPSAEGGAFYSGAAYVVFGKASGFTSNFNLSTLSGANGLRLDGVAASDGAGSAVSGSGDVNGDGFGDLIVGAQGANAKGKDSGATYVVFGKASGFDASLDLSSLDGMNGFRLEGETSYDRSGRAVSAAGDVNGDGFDDLIIGAPFAQAAGVGFYDTFGASYVVFGKAGGFSATMNLSALDGTNGFRLTGVAEGDETGFSVSGVGDVNGDGFDDVIVGAYQSGDTNGVSYLVFGKASGFNANFSLSSLNGTNGFRINGAAAADADGFSVSGAGDVNGDGFDDLIVGAPAHLINGPGTTYVMYGKAGGFAANINLSTLDGAQGFRLEAAAVDDDAGSSVSAAGDVNGDGFDDLIVGAPGGGASYVIFGGDFNGAVTDLGTSGADSLTGTSAAERFVSGQGNDTLKGGGGADVFNAGAGNDLIQVLNTAFRDVDGGSGTDTLRLVGNGRTLDLTTLANNKISGIEIIDITGSGDNTLELARRDLFDLSGSTNQLTVDGNSGDTVDLVGVWGNPVAAGAYDSYTMGAATILIDTDIFVT